MLKHAAIMWFCLIASVLVGQTLDNATGDALALTYTDDFETDQARTDAIDHSPFWPQRANSRSVPAPDPKTPTPSRREHLN